MSFNLPADDLKSNLSDPPYDLRWFPLASSPRSKYSFEGWGRILRLKPASPFRTSGLIPSCGHDPFLESQVKKSPPHTYSMPQRVWHASLGNLELLHQKANGNTMVSTHCEQENEITWPIFPHMAAEIHKKCLTIVLVFFNFWLSFWR